MKVVGFAGYSGSGKTTLVEQLIGELKQRGLRVSVVKHAHHKFDIDQPGKDTFRHRAAGAFEVVAASSQRMALMREFEQPAQINVHHLIAELYTGLRPTPAWRRCIRMTILWSPSPQIRRTCCPNPPCVKCWT